ncbi:MAG: phosphopantetheine-binding protein [Micrococcales bacterium]|nr:MAG: phosphopantetheine-binding protein [Micrococcales bacterium]
MRGCVWYRTGRRRVVQWLVKRVSTELGVDSRRIDPHRSFGILGLNSAAILGITGDLEQWLGVRVTPNLPYDYPSIGELATHLAEEALTTSRRPSAADSSSLPS